MDATIVIPTKNAGQILDCCLHAVFNQATEYSFEVVCVDSGSSDETLNIIKKYPCDLLEIRPEEFGHGKTRNLGVSRGSGEYIVFLTQDAVPVNEHWLQKFIDAMKIDEEIVAGFGKHCPYPDCNLFDKRDLAVHFKNFGEINTIYAINDQERYEKDEGYRHMLAFFSDNNSCIKREIWKKYPYPDVDFAEDQIWARRMIELGYKKIYCPEAVVYHSHNYPLKTYLKRYYDEYKGLYNLHKYIIAPSRKVLLKMYLANVKSDFQYLKSISLSGYMKCYWFYYSAIRNLYRYYGGYLGGHYHECSEEKKKQLDKKYSQQLMQRKA
ncbi:glycosyltransferase family 2 protein [Eubacterium aggregans]|uniref:glycosyltransferase family 2 protein n=1 Tax=Eubacterium aggregans TaxID=81409 RepID=UPI003F351BD0